MQEKWIIVDGYSVLHTWRRLVSGGGRALEQRRERLVKMLQQYADHWNVRVKVVFDGYAAKHQPEQVETTQDVEVLFSKPGKTADDLIERLVGQSEQAARALVVSSDHLVRQTVESMGAQSVSAEAFEREVESALKELAGKVREHSRKRQINPMRERLER